MYSPGGALVMRSDAPLPLCAAGPLNANFACQILFVMTTVPPTTFDTVTDTSSTSQPGRAAESNENS